MSREDVEAEVDPAGEHQCIGRRLNPLLGDVNTELEYRNDVVCDVVDEHDGCSVGSVVDCV